MTDRFLVLVSACLLGGCSPAVSRFDEAGGVEVPVPGCSEALPSTPPASRKIDVRDFTSASFAGDLLHVVATVDGEERYSVLRIESPDVAYDVSPFSAMPGPARFVPLTEDVFARVWVDDRGAVLVEAIAPEVPESPEVVSRLDLGAEVDGLVGGAFAAVDGRVLFCTRPVQSEELRMVAVDLRDPAHPLPPEEVGGDVCDRYPDGGIAAAGSTWMVWGQEYDLDLYTVTPGGADHIGDYYYNPDGIHSYGAVVAAATDGHSVVFDPENDSEFFFFDLPEPLYYVTHAWLGLTGPKHLLGLVGGLVYLATPDGVRAYEVADIDAPVLSGFHADVAFAPGPAQLLASSDDYLAIADAAGTLFLVPTDHRGSVGPLGVYEPSSAPGAPPLCP